MVAIPSGVWYIGGEFTQVGGISRNRLARINADGSLHPFNPNMSNIVYAHALDASGCFLQSICRGGFTTVGSTTRNGHCKFDNAGALQPFDPNMNLYVYALALDASGKPHIGGQFKSPIPNYEVYSSASACTATTGTINTTICSGASYLFNGVNRTTIGAYLDTLVNAGGCVKYNGLSNDKDEIANAIGLNTLNATINNVYRSEDCNSDGKIRYNNADNDRVIILNNIGINNLNYLINQHTSN